jgi:epoxyqueuosine reductase
MPSNMDPNMTDQIIDKAKSSGASLAGVARVDSLLSSPSHEQYDEVALPRGAKSILVLGLVHGETEPELDWWDGNRGTPGNRRLIEIGGEVAKWLKKEYKINARDLPYHVEKGGVFLKDAAVLAGLGTIGLNNLLITPQYGPRVRLRALVLDRTVVPSGPVDFDSCAGCEMPCKKACPQNAFRDGPYSRALCNEQMERDKASPVPSHERDKKGRSSFLVKYCRACELACPIGQ